MFPLDVILEAKISLSLMLFSSGPLFSFDVHDDIRLVNDATVEKDEVKFLVFLQQILYNASEMFLSLPI